LPPATNTESSGSDSSSYRLAAISSQHGDALESRKLTAESGTGRRREAVTVFLLYAALTILFTWPLARGLTRDVPGDFGDPLLNAWILAWDTSHLGRGWWNANIYYPHPLALAYSEHLLPQALAIWPVQAIANNPLLSYNVAFLATFVLSGLGMYLLVREMTNSRAAAFVAGVAYAFGPYRVTSMPHLQVLSSQWMPFALYGFRRFFVTFKLRAATGGAAAWLLQNLSCGYYLLFFSPVLLAYLAWELTTRSLWTSKRIVLILGAACIVVCAVTGTFAVPYLELRAVGFSPRSLEETTRFSADTYALFTADPNLRLWGSILQAWPKAEGALFPGLVIVGLAFVGVVMAQRGQTPFLIDKRGLTPLLGVASFGLLIALLFGWSIRWPVLKVANFPRTLLVVAVIWAIALATSPRLRRAVAQWLATPAGFFTVVAVFAIVMSWGPSIHARGRTIASSNLYTLFYNYAPGFDGVRAPARFAMILTLALSVLAGLGVAALTRRRRALAWAIVLGAAVLVEGLAVPIPINQNAIDYRRPGLAPLPGSVADVPPVYELVAKLPPGTPIVELPLGEPAFDVRYMLYSTTHWQPLVNGYSGGAPADYERLDQSLQDALTRPEPAWQALTATRASHAIVHEAFYTENRGRRISEWLQANGAQELAVFGTDRIFRIR
jgi:hypothetical protein